MTGDETLRSAPAAIRAGSKSFAAAARLFEPATREGAVLLYAWCRHCDDVVDGQELGFAAGGEGGAADEPAERLARLERETRRALAGEPTGDAAFGGLAEVMRRHAIPDRYPLQHLAGFRMDVENRRYRVLADTLDYAYHVAGVVGIMMAHVMDARDPAVLDRACDLGLAFQLTNIARDVVADAAVGRVYLPEAWLVEAGLDPDPRAIVDEAGRPALAGVAARLVAAAEPYYDSAAIGIAALPPRAAWAIATARSVYREIGREVVRRGSRAWDARVATSKAAKLLHVGQGAAGALRSRFAGRERAPPRPALYVRPR